MSNHSRPSDARMICQDWCVAFQAPSHMSNAPCRVSLSFWKTNALESKLLPSIYVGRLLRIVCARSYCHSILDFTLLNLQQFRLGACCALRDSNWFSSKSLITRSTTAHTAHNSYLYSKAKMPFLCKSSPESNPSQSEFIRCNKCVQRAHSACKWVS